MRIKGLKVYGILNKIGIILVLLQISIFAGPTGIITDLYQMELDSLNQISKKTSQSVMQQKMDAFNQAFEVTGVDMEIQNESWDDKKRLKKIIDEVEANLPSSYGTNLGDVTDLLDTENKIANIISTAKDLKDAYKYTKKATKELSEWI